MIRTNIPVSGLYKSDEIPLSQTASLHIERLECYLKFDIFNQKIKQNNF